METAKDDKTEKFEKNVPFLIDLEWFKRISKRKLNFLILSLIKLSLDT